MHEATKAEQAAGAIPEENDRPLAAEEASARGEDQGPRA